MIDKLETRVRIKEEKFGSYPDAVSKVRQWYGIIFDGLSGVDAQSGIPKNIEDHKALIRKRKATAVRQFMFS